MNNIRLAIVGSRTFNDYNMVVKVLSQLRHDYDYNYIEIVSGGAKGADAFGERYANENSIKLSVFPADWKKWGDTHDHIMSYNVIGLANVTDEKRKQYEEKLEERIKANTQH